MFKLNDRKKLKIEFLYKIFKEKKYENSKNILATFNTKQIEIFKNAWFDYINDTQKKKN